MITMITMIRNKTCPYCGYEWTSRKEEPKECPRCKRRFDYPNNKEFLNKEIVIRGISKRGKK